MRRIVPLSITCLIVVLVLVLPVPSARPGQRLSQGSAVAALSAQASSILKGGEKMECVDCPRRFISMTDRSLSLDAGGHPHFAYGEDHLYYAWHDGASLHYETVDDSPGVGGYAALTLTGDGYPHISYYDDTNGDLKYAYQDDRGWHLETVDTMGQVGWYTSLALDSDGYAHISYYNCGNASPCDVGDLKYAYQDAAGWHAETVDSAGDVGQYTSLAWDGNGYSHVSYFDSSNGDLKYAYRDAGGWHTETLDSAGYVGEYSSLALDGSGYPHISYYDYSNGDLEYAYQDAGGWHFETVDSVGEVGWYTSLVLDGNGYPHISYSSIYFDMFAFYPDDLKYAYQDAGGWHVEIVDSAGYVGAYVSLALDGGGYPHISYYDDSNDDLKYAYQDAGGWHLATVDSVGSVGQYTSLALDWGGYAHISYYDQIGDAVKYAGEDAGGWYLETVDAGLGYYGGHTSLTLDGSDYPHISYFDYSNSDLKYAYRDAGGWHVEIVDSPGTVGWYPSLTLDGSGYPHISYSSIYFDMFAYHPDDLRYAYQDAGGWYTETVDSDGYVGEYTSLALDGSGYSHISYYDDTNDHLKYAYQDAGGWHVATVDSTGSVGEYTSLALDGSGYAHISYRGAGLKYAYQDAAGWHLETVDNEGDAGWYTALALDGSGYPHISYYDSANGDLKYAYQDADGWKIVTVDSAGDVGKYPSLVLDGNGYPHISYYDDTNDDLRYISYTTLPSPGDDYEVDDTCGVATSIATDGTVQTHTFHDEGDEDWVKLNAEAGNTYVIRVDNVGDNVDAVVMLYNQCDAPPLEEEDNAFGPTVELEWDCTVDGEYYVGVLQHDPSVYGEDTNYDLSVAVDAEPPSPPPSLRASAADRTLIVQWDPSPERDVVGYRVEWHRDDYSESGSILVNGADNTYSEITELTNGALYYIAIRARDFTGNESDLSAEIGAIPSSSADPTQPSVFVNRPSADPEYTTTLGSLTIGGICTDAGENLIRVQVRNTTNGAEGWDYSLAGGSAPFNVESIPLVIGDNQIEVTVYDAADNTATDSLTIHRLGEVSGVVVIVGGHNNSYSLQTNINYATNRAYRIFQGAGYGTEEIYYLSPGPQDADGDGADDVDATTTPANVHAALQWAAGEVGPGDPFHLYLMDHGGVEKFCADGCASDGRIASEELNAWLDELEASSGCDQVNVIIEACHSGSFIDTVDDTAKSIAKDGRVVIASTDRDHNAYASAQGAYFSDAFFSAAAESSNLLVCFNQGRTAVEATGREQTPWLDDNGDGESDSSDGAYAANRYVAGFFGTLLPEITSALVSIEGTEGAISVRVERGDEPLDLVWAAVYAPSFQEPATTTLELGVPLIALEPDLERGGLYSANYGGFVEEGGYQVVIYAEDQAGHQAPPRLARLGEYQIYLPLVLKDGS